MCGILKLENFLLPHYNGNHIMVGARHSMEQNTLDLDTLLNNIETGVWITNSFGDILYTNHAYRQIRQLPKEWFDSHNAFQDHSDGITSVSPTKVVCESKQGIHLVQHITGTEGGVSISLFISCQPIFDATGNVTYVVGSVIPVEQLNRMYLESLLTDHQYYTTAPQFKSEPDVVAESPEMKRVLALASQVSDTRSTILISGESGVGKNVLAGYIHRHSARQDAPMVEVNCAALPESLLEAELFGYEPGAFTNALRQGKRGLFDEAAGVTLFLDEINSMSLNLQSKLLQAIETKHRIDATLWAVL